MPPERLEPPPPKGPLNLLCRQEGRKNHRGGCRPKQSREQRRKNLRRASASAGNNPDLADGFGVSKHSQDTGIAPAHFVYAGGGGDCAFGSCHHNSRGKSGRSAGMVSHVAEPADWRRFGGTF